MNRILVGVAVAAMAALSGCATGARAYADTAISNRSEPASVWNRPQEVGFDWGAEITGEATHQCVLGFICWGYEDGSALDGIGALIGGILGNGGAPAVDGLVRAAAAVAVRDTPKADGIFIVAHDTDAFNIFVYNRRTAHVRGKAFTLRPIGEVSQDRADKVRNLRSVGGLVNVPFDVFK